MSPCHRSVREFRQLPPFMGVSRRELRRLGALCVTISFASGKVLAQQGRLCREFVILAEGTARAIGDGHEISVVEAGHHFGEVGLVLGIRNPVTIVADTAVTLEVMSTREFLTAYKTMPALRKHIDEVIDRQIASWSDVTPSRHEPERPDVGAADADDYTLAS